MTGGSSTETPLPTSICCAPWRTKPQHGDCPGRVRLGNLGPLVPCGCEPCAGRPNHRADIAVVRR